MNKHVTDKELEEMVKAKVGELLEDFLVECFNVKYNNNHTVAEIKIQLFKDDGGT